jgi:hypothetical protein
MTEEERQKIREFLRENLSVEVTISNAWGNTEVRVELVLREEEGTYYTFSTDKDIL